MDLSTLYDHIIKFLPRFEIIQPDEIGVFVRGGKFKKTISSGVYFCWPYFDEIFTLRFIAQVLNLPHQSVKTNDGKVLAIRCGIVFTITDAQKAIIDVENVDEYLKIVISNRVTEFINENNLEDIDLTNIKEYVLDEEFKEELINDVGVKLETLTMYDLSPHRVLRLMSTDNTQLENN